MSNNRKDTLIVLGTLIISILFLSLLNLITGPFIEKNNSKAELEPLFEVMADASGFEKLELANLPSTVTEVYKETSGKGYVIKCSTNKGFTGKDITFRVAISAEGKVTGVALDDYPETKDFGADYPSTYIGSDSTLSTVEIVAGVTYSSTAFKNAVADAFTALDSNGLVKAAEKEPGQVYEEMLTTVFGEALSPKGLLVAEDFTSAVSGVQNAKLSGNKAGVCYWIEENGVNYVVVANRSALAVYGMDGKVSDGLSSAAKDALMNEALSTTKDETKKDLKKLKKLGTLTENAVFTEISLDGIYSSVTCAYTVEDEGKTYYALAMRPYGFGNETMVMYILLTGDGKIASFSVKELIIEADYFSGYTLPDGYYSSFEGLDSSWSGDEALISGATLSTDAVRDAVNDAFDAYRTIKGGN